MARFECVLTTVTSTKLHSVMLTQRRAWSTFWTGWEECSTSAPSIARKGTTKSNFLTRLSKLLLLHALLAILSGQGCPLASKTPQQYFNVSWTWSYPVYLGSVAWCFLMTSLCSATLGRTIYEILMQFLLAWSKQTSH